ncbi:phytochelatin synthase family protein [Phormidium sp. LEGE 05292]|uniref:phytochelatin synthase family protein n=1 Tax=[Phormidium] sp. LEGE 05292 TaxID=767427 RepID=UPI00187E4228|nr:phytochelatin synthase family protein [Phormidium sp. LEGE 05292]MBE9227287.1 phytochelatin synthase family protein [Phormidium sp. LEGE 05292]
MNTKGHLLRLLKIIGIPSLTFLLGFGVASIRPQTKQLPISQNLISLDSTEGEQLLIASTAKQDYLPLSIHFITQENQAYCGVASIVMVLNALSIPAPVEPKFGNVHVFTQDNVFNAQMINVKTPSKISFEGMTLEELGKLLKSYPLKVEVHYASNMTLNEFRNMTVKNLQESNNFVIVNYLRKSVGQQIGGHISPIAAYNQKTDRFLILDVSRYKYPPVWVKAEELWRAMATKDPSTGKTRGLVLVSKS